MTSDAAIPAATILLLRDAPSFEVLMIARHENTPFAGGAMVFPGGRIDDADAADDLRDCCDGYDACPEDQIAPRVAAIREAFEETGILLAKGPDGAFINGDACEALSSWRPRIEENAALFAVMVKETGMRLALDALCLFARWEPPVGATHRRYHTWFFAARAPAGQWAIGDGREATEALWITPKDAQADAAAGNRKLIFPTLRNVELLGVSDSVESVVAFAQKRRIDVVIPKVAQRDGKPVLTIPDDMGYPITFETLESAMRA